DMPGCRVRGAVPRGGRVMAEFDHWSRRDESACGASPFYRALHQAGPARPAAPRPAEDRAVRGWEQLYENLYATPRPAADPGFDVIGWDSTYNGRPIPVDQMHEQVDGTVDRVRQLGGRRILEIGCGTGLLLFRLAPGCNQYLATDFAPAAVAAVAAECRRRGLAQVEVVQRRGRPLSGAGAR